MENIIDTIEFVTKGIAPELNKDNFNFYVEKFTPQKLTCYGTSQTGELPSFEVVIKLKDNKPSSYYFMHDDYFSWIYQNGYRKYKAFSKDKLIAGSNICRKFNCIIRQLVPNIRQY